MARTTEKILIPNSPERGFFYQRLFRVTVNSMRSLFKAQLALRRACASCKSDYAEAASIEAAD
jgi:hypothetical protein